MSDKPSDPLAYPKPTAPGVYRVSTEWNHPTASFGSSSVNVFSSELEEAAFINRRIWQQVAEKK